MAGHFSDSGNIVATHWAIIGATDICPEADTACEELGHVDNSDETMCREPVTHIVWEVPEFNPSRVSGPDLDPTDAHWHVCEEHIVRHQT